MEYILMMGQPFEVPDKQERDKMSRLLISRGFLPQEADKLLVDATHEVELIIFRMIQNGERKLPKTIDIPIYRNGEHEYTITFPVRRIR